jgi:hypothetical protein
MEMVGWACVCVRLFYNSTVSSWYFGDRRDFDFGETSEDNLEYVIATGATELMLVPASDILTGLYVAGLRRGAYDLPPTVGDLLLLLLLLLLEVGECWALVAAPTKVGDLPRGSTGVRDGDA